MTFAGPFAPRLKVLVFVCVLSVGWRLEVRPNVHAIRDTVVYCMVSSAVHCVDPVVVLACYSWYRRYILPITCGTVWRRCSFMGKVYAVGRCG